MGWWARLIGSSLLVGGRGIGVKRLGEKEKAKTKKKLSFRPAWTGRRSVLGTAQSSDLFIN